MGLSDEIDRLLGIKPHKGGTKNWDKHSGVRSGTKHSPNTTSGGNRKSDVRKRREKNRK